MGLNRLLRERKRERCHSKERLNRNKKYENNNKVKPSIKKTESDIGSK